MAGKGAPDNLLSGRVARAVGLREFAAEVKRRANDQKDPNNTLLSPDELGGDYVLSRALYTTDGGKPRMITHDDLRNFSARTKELKKAAKKGGFSGGIKAKQVIDRSWQDDRDRANSQIHMASPVAYRAVTEGGGQGSALLVQFMVSASRTSAFTHHNVNVQFLRLGEEVGSPDKAIKAAKRLTSGALKFECSCPRFKYFFRYIASQAGYVCGRVENAFPKITNPRITGVACKHALRVMQVIDRSAAFQGYIAKAIQKFRDDIEHTEQTERIADQRELEAKIKRESHARRNIKTTEEKRTQREGQPSYQRAKVEREARAAARAADKAANDQLRKTKAAKVNKPVAPQKAVAALMTLGYSEKAAKAMIAAAAQVKD